MIFHSGGELFIRPPPETIFQFAGYRLHRLMIVPNFVFTCQFFNLPRNYMYRGLKINK